jgi:hypothetical protein
MKKLNVLIGCEESGVVRDAFRKLGHDAYSCDLQECSGDPTYHLQMDVFEAIKLKKWDLAIFHPPCTYLTVTGNKWFYHPDDKHLPTTERRPHPRFPNRRQQQKDAIEFFIALHNANIPSICLENPVGVISSVFRKPDQIIQPYMFGDNASKQTCIWVKNLPLLKPTDIVDAGERVYYKSGKSHPKWYADAVQNKDVREKVRSKTFQGIADAMASQYSEYLTKNS